VSATDSPPAATEQVWFCTWHPERETLLRCSRCTRPMCVRCAVRHPVGMRCRECARELRSPVYVVSPGRLLAGILAALAASVAAAVLLQLAALAVPFGSWIVAFLLGDAAGKRIADLASRAAAGKRGRSLQVGVAVAMVAAVGAAGFAVATVLTLAAGATTRPPLPPLAASIAPYLRFETYIYLFLGVGAATRRLR
jgi:hypothetical protein